jgi:hypothetical protein
MHDPDPRSRRRLTRFQRVNLGLGLTALLVLAAAASAGRAQTFEEAVRANVALAIQLCMQPGLQGPQRAGTFRTAGFAERVEAFGNGDTTHYFSAPAETASVELYYGNMPEECRVMSGHMGVTGASALLDRIIPPLYPGYVRIVEQGPIDPATGQPATCVRYQQPNSQIPHVIGVIPGNGADGCIANGTSTVFDATLV